MTEAGLAVEVISYLEQDGWVIYQEVAPSRYVSQIADIVATKQLCRGRLLVHVVEVKQSLNLGVIEQAQHWRRMAHQVSVAFKEPKKRNRNHEFARRICRDYGLGVLEVTKPTRWNRSRVTRVAVGQFNRNPVFDWSKVLCEEMKTVCAAGTPGGGYWTPFKATCADLVQYVRGHQGCTFQEAVAAISHHYANEKSARANLKDMVEKGVVKELEVIRVDSTPRLFLAQSSSS